jgi:hypothetical protein
MRYINVNGTSVKINEKIEIELNIKVPVDEFVVSPDNLNKFDFPHIRLEREELKISEIIQQVRLDIKILSYSFSHPLICLKSYNAKKQFIWMMTRY